MSDWQLIETAPKDGTFVWLWEPEPQGGQTGCYVDFERVGGAPEGYRSGWYDGCSGYRELKPTHWIPLPDPPVQP